MSEYTREEILRLIEENGGPQGLDLSNKDLSGLDLSAEAISAELRKALELDATPVWFSETTGGISLQDAWLGGTNFEGSNLGRADLRKARLESANLQGVNLLGANLQEVSLRSAKLEAANLQFVELQRALLEHANLPKAKLKGADLQEARLGYANLQEASPWYANLQGADLLCANLQGARLSHANLQRANLMGAELQGADLVYANLQGADPLEANFQGANLIYSHVEKLDLFAAKSLEGAYFYNAFLDDTRMRRDQLGEEIGEEKDERYGRAKEAYLALKNNFAEIGRYRDESWAYVKERQMGKMMHHPRLARRYFREELPKNPNAWRLAWFFARHTAKWLSDWFVELLCGYGESLWRVLAWMLLVILGFATYYQVSHAVVTSSQDAVTSLWDHLIFSLGAFTTLQPARLQAASPGVELWATIQAIIGISLAGLLGFVTGNRIRRS